MGFIGKMFKGAVAAKVVSEARKPQNQARAKSALASLRSKVSGKSAASSSRLGRKQAPVTGRPAKPSTRTR